MTQNSLQQSGSQPNDPISSQTTSKLDREIVFPLLMIIISGLILVLISQFDEPHYQDASVNAQFFPSAIAIAQIIVCIALIAQRKLKTTIQQPTMPLLSKMALFGIGFLVVYALLIHIIGYLIASLITFTAYLAFFKVKKPLYYLIACCFVFGVYYLFGEVFYIALPQGLYN